MNRAGALVALVVAGLLFGCSGTPAPDLPSTPSTVSVTADPQLRATLPERARQSGRLVVAVDEDQAPMSFDGDDGPEGTDIDLFNALAAQLGAEPTYVYAELEEILLGVQDGTYDVGMAGLSITPERLEQVTMVSYFKSGNWWVVPAGNPAELEPGELCGHDVSVERGTIQFDTLTDANATCGRTGKEQVTILAVRQQSNATDAVLSGAADAMLADGPVALYVTKQYDGKLELLGEPYDVTPFGIVVAKDQSSFAESLLTALQRSRENGEYERILRNWGNERGEIATFEINPQVSGGPAPSAG